MESVKKIHQVIATEDENVTELNRIYDIKHMEDF